MYCKRCGKEIADYAAMCPSCGAMVMETNGAGDVSIGDWMVTLFLAAIPIVGLIMVLVWAFSGGTNPSKQNWARATLLWGVILIGVGVIISIASATLLAGLLGSM